MTDILQCQKCGKTIGFGFTGYCHSLELLCIECGENKK